MTRSKILSPSEREQVVNRALHDHWTRMEAVTCLNASHVALEQKLADSLRFCNGEWPCEASTSAAALERECNDSAADLAEAKANFETYRKNGEANFAALVEERAALARELGKVREERDDWHRVADIRSKEIIRLAAQVAAERDHAQARVEELAGAARRYLDHMDVQEGRAEPAPELEPDIAACNREEWCIAREALRRLLTSSSRAPSMRP